MTLIKEVEFVGSFTDIKQCPDTGLPEYAFIGRSNVGKSSLINYLTGRNQLARISSSPGKTQTINYYLINQSWYLVDLPGYGYAKVSKKLREKWQKATNEFLKKRMSIYCIFSLIDSRHTLQKLDLDFVNWLGQNSLPFAIVFTKVDKLKDKESDNHLDSIKAQLLEHWEYLPTTFMSSTVKKIGGEDILEFITEINNK